MYSEKAVNKAHQCLHENISINSKICKVRKVKGRCTDLPLAKEKCEKLANYYLGFNGWNSRLLYHQHESSEVVGNECDKSTSNIITEKYATAINITLPYVKNRNLSVEGVGIGLSDWNTKCPEGKGKARSFAAKQSRSAALQNAFSKLILIVLDDGKVTVEIDMNKNDPFVYSPIWDVPSIIVNEVYYEEKDQLGDSDFENLELLETLAP